MNAPPRVIGSGDALVDDSPENLPDRRSRRVLLTEAFRCERARGDEQLGGGGRERTEPRITVICVRIRRDVFGRVRELRCVTSVTVRAIVTA